MNINEILKQEFSLKDWQIENTIKLIDDDNTIPFIARYRKELTGGLDDQLLRSLFDRLTYLRNLEEQQSKVKETIESQGALTEEIIAALEDAATLTEVEDIYRPYRPKRKTRASVAKEKGLEPLAEILLLQAPDSKEPTVLAEEYVNAEKGVETVEDALSGARDIIAVRNDKGIDFDRLAEAELNSDLDINILRSYGVAPAAYIAEPVQREEIGGLEPTPVKSESKKKSAATPTKELPAPKPEEPKVQPSRLPEGMMRDILESMPIGTPVSADFFAGFALDPGKLVGYISMLEVSGYITSIPGGTYLRKF